MHTTHSNTQYKNESKHSEMGPVRQHIQAEVGSLLMTIIINCQVLQWKHFENYQNEFGDYRQKHCGIFSAPNGQWRHSIRRAGSLVWSL